MENQKNMKQRTPEYYAKRDAEQLAKNLELLEKPDSIVIIPFSKPKRFALVHMVRHMDRISTNIRRRIGFGVDFDEAKDLLTRLETFVDKLWSEMQTLAPNLHDCKKENWRKLNDFIDYRRTLVHRKMAFVFIPKSEEAGQAAMAVKIIENQNFTLRGTSGSFDELKDITERYLSICYDFDSLLCSLAEKCNVFYKSQYQQPKDESVTEATTKKTKT